MNVLVQFCFIHVVGGYVNVAQITDIRENSGVQVCLTRATTVSGCLPTRDKTPEDFLDRVKKTCGGKHD